MKILLLGAGGFLGRHFETALAAAGHAVVRGVRAPCRPTDIAVDYRRDLTADIWLPRLAGIDVAINAIGIIVEAGEQRFDTIHTAAPVALFEACVKAGVRRVIQLSALGADRGGTRYFSTKRTADEALMRLPIDWQIIRPALVFGEAGQSARLFLALASLPLVPLPAGGRQRLQPVYIDDLAEAVLRLADPKTPARQCVELVGPQLLGYREMLDAYRAGLGLPPAPHLAIPAPLMTIAATAAERIPGALFNRGNWRMLQAGNTGEAEPAARVLGREPRPIERFIPRERSDDLRRRALSDWHLPLLRASLAAVWLLAAIVSAFVHPLADSLALLARVGLEGVPALAALYGAAGLDFALGAATLISPGRRLWGTQIALVVAYTAIIAVALPEFLTHPFGPVVKNLPIVAILLVLHSQETRS